MARSLEQILQEQLGGLVFALCVKDAEIEKLKDENEALKKVIVEKK